jgi:archaellum biogenesis ATPase FlaH
MLPETWTDNLDDANHGPGWIWRGLLAPGQITLMTGLWKTGKTTLLSHLLSRRRMGGDLLDLPVTHGPTAVFTEESRSQWLERARKLALGPDICFFCRPFIGRPTRAQFDDMIAQLLELRRRRGVNLAVFDPLTCFMPAHTENSSDEALAAMGAMRTLADASMAVLLPHHPAKGNPGVGQAARGTGALSAFADVLLELRPSDPDNPADRRRLLYAFSRSPETPSILRIELKADGSDYITLPASPLGDFPRYWPVLVGVLEEAQDKMTRAQMLDQWPADFPRPSLATLWRWLDTACDSNLIAREGTGRSADPFRYWLRARERAWLDNPLYRVLHRLPPLPNGNEGTAPK